MSIFEQYPDFASFHWWMEVIDVVLVLFLVYQLYKFVRGTAAIRIFLGAIAIYTIWKTTEFLQMELLHEILGQFIGVGVIALIVVFQQEIRKFLLLIASPKIYNRFWLTKWMFRFKRQNDEEDEIQKEPIINACERLSKNKTGALIVVSKEYDLDLYKSLGETIDSELNEHLLEAIFHKESPLHDGAVLIADNRIVAARCVLPVSDRQDIPPQLGLRHRAAVGITENSNAIAIVVSEQNGTISVCNGGKLKNDVSVGRLKRLINFLPQ